MVEVAFHNCRVFNEVELAVFRRDSGSIRIGSRADSEFKIPGWSSRIAFLHFQEKTVSLEARPGNTPVCKNGVQLGFGRKEPLFDGDQVLIGDLLMEVEIVDSTLSCRALRVLLLETGLRPSRVVKVAGRLRVSFKRSQPVAWALVQQASERLALSLGQWTAPSARFRVQTRSGEVISLPCERKNDRDVIDPTRLVLSDDDEVFVENGGDELVLEIDRPL